jgi:Insertion element 4 transposase N-terminal
MPRAGQLKPPVEERLSDRVAIGALTATFPPELVDRVLAQTGKREQRRRLLPARMVVYCLLALALFADVAYLEVLRLLVEALRRGGRRRRATLAPRLPVKSALVQARVRLGPEPLRALFAQAARPLATPHTQGAWYRAGGWGRWTGPRWTRPTPRQRGGVRAGQERAGEGTGAFPQVPVVGLVECGTHATVGAVLGPTGRARSRWPVGCSAGWSRALAGCCCWPTGCLWARSCGGPPPRPARRCGGAPRPARPLPSCPSIGSLRTARGCRGWTPQATGANATRSWCGCWSIAWMTLAGRRRPGRSTGW